jgi:hypothetical protein
MKTKNDKSLEEVWEMKKLAHIKFETSEYDNYLEYINFRQKEFDLKLNLSQNQNNIHKRLEVV